MGGLHDHGNGIKIKQVTDNEDIEREGIGKNEERNKGSKSEEVNCLFIRPHETIKEGSL